MSEKCPICRVMGNPTLISTACVWNEEGERMTLIVPPAVLKQMVKIADDGNCEFDVNGVLVKKRSKYCGKAV